MPKGTPSPLPLFDILDNINKVSLPSDIKFPFAALDFKIAQAFLKLYGGSQTTFNSYRREIERLLQWAWLVQKKSVITLKRDDIEAYLKFCKQPPKTWIGTAKVPRFIEEDGQRKANPAWRPFVATVTKVESKKGMIPDKQPYALSDKAFKEIFAVLSSFYNFLIQKECTQINPLLQLRQKSKFFRKRQGTAPIRRLSELQWQTVVEVTKKMAADNPLHERSLFIITALYAMYLRISELAASKRWLPKTIEQIERVGFKDEAESLQAATVHWLRHTSISDDVLTDPLIL